MTPALDRDRLLADLRAAAEAPPPRLWPQRASRYWRFRGYMTACRVIAAAIVDGDYDVDPVVRYGLTARGEQVAGMWPYGPRGGGDDQ